MADIRTKQLQNAVEYLKGMRVIVKDVDIAEKTGYLRSQISNYLRGTVPPSRPFQAKFEEVYGISFEDFNEPRKHKSEFQKLVTYQTVQLALLAKIAERVGVDKKEIANIISVDPDILEKYKNMIKHNAGYKPDTIVSVKFIEPKKKK